MFKEEARLIVCMIEEFDCREGKKQEREQGEGQGHQKRTKREFQKVFVGQSMEDYFAIIKRRSLSCVRIWYGKGWRRKKKEGRGHTYNTRVVGRPRMDDRT